MSDSDTVVESDTETDIEEDDDKVEKEEDTECSVKYTKEQMMESKLLTEKGLIDIGVEMARLRGREEEFVRLRDYVCNYTNYYNGRYRRINSEFRRSLLDYVNMVDDKLEKNRRDIDNIRSDYDIVVEESDETEKELEKLQRLYDLSRIRYERMLFVRDNTIRRLEYIVLFLCGLVFGLFVYVRFGKIIVG